MTLAKMMTNSVRAILKILKKFVTIACFRNLIYKGGEMVSDFDAIYQEYGKTVYCFLLSLSRDETLSEELTQETMFRAIIYTWHSKRKLEHTTDLKGD